MELLFVTKFWNDTWFLRDTQKKLKITSYGRKKILSSSQWCLLETSTVIITLVFEILYLHVLR